jgi:hypothetical protein
LILRSVADNLFLALLVFRVVTAMITQMYFVESHRIPMLPEKGLPLAGESVPVGLVQFTGRSSEWFDGKLEQAAKKVLMSHSPLTNDRAHGFGTWRARLVTEDDESLGVPTFEDADKGYRVWVL